VTTSGLSEQAQAFASRITATVQAVAPSCSPFRSRLIEETQRVQVHQEPNTGIPLNVGGQPLLTLTVSYKCCLDGADRYLAIDSSEIKVFSGTKAQGEPLFRFDYERQPSSPDIPAAHIQIHAHRDAITFVMASAGTGSRRGKRRAGRAKVPRLSELHFPVGGHRFRPCLEDVLDMLATELGVDCSEPGREALRAGREDWRRLQARAVVRDAPGAAAEVLTSLGYDVRPPANGHAPDHSSRLRDF
jgi:hypothetical protein